MKKLLLIAILLSVVLIPQGLLAQATNPDPFNTARVPNTPPTPVVVQSAPPAEPGVNGMAQTGILAILAGLMGKLAFFNKPTTAPPATGEIPTHPVMDPRVLDTLILKLVQSGAPGEAIQVALSFIPGAGPILAKLEPAFHAISVKFLQDKIASQSVDPTAAPVNSNILNVLADLVAKHKQGTTP